MIIHCSKINVIFALYLFLAVIFIQGCGSGEPISSPGRACILADRQEVMSSAKAALLDLGFVIEKFDSEAGYIRTRPLSGSQFFELWRGDIASSYALTEASLHSVMRTVQMNFNEDEGRVCVLCEVSVMRLSVPEQGTAGTSGTYAMFTKSSSQLMTLRFSPQQQSQMAWIDMGLDSELAEKVLGNMEVKLLAGRGLRK